jgi:hypothetical protein
MEQVQEALLEKVIKQIEHLPTLPQVVTKVLAMTDSAHISAVALSNLDSHAMRKTNGFSVQNGEKAFFEHSEVNDKQNL